MTNSRRDILRVLRSGAHKGHHMDLREFGGSGGVPYSEIPWKVKEAVLLCWMRYCCPKHRLEIGDCVGDDDLMDEKMMGWPDPEE